MKASSSFSISDRSRGRWLVETLSGTRHVFDLGRMTYLRHGRHAVRGRGLAKGVPYDIVEIEQWPRVNGVFRIWVAVGHDTELQVVSSYVTRIVRMSEADGDPESVRLSARSLLEQVAQAPPVNAWLLIGDDASFPTASELRAQRNPKDPDLPIWTCPRQIDRGDLAFIYFIHPRKAIHFATRALIPPFYDASMEVNAEKAVDPHQWWTDLAPLVPIPPISYGLLRQLADDPLVLKGKPTHYLTPTMVNRIIGAIGDLDAEQRLVLQAPLGDPDLPDPATMRLADLRRIAGGCLSVERMVEQYVVEPLFRLCRMKDAELRRQLRLPGAGVVDYGLCVAGEVRAVIEVKLGVRRPRDGDLRGSPDVQQVVRYAKAANTPGLLVDANSIFLIDRGGDSPSSSFDRRSLSRNHLSTIGRHLRGTE